jgi:type II secretory pathway pseudopilin PulG
MCVIMIIGTTVAMKVWSTVIQRDREDELIFRGRQYAMALRLYQKAKGTLPAELKMLDEKGEGGKYYLRRQYKDPITGQDFGVIMAGPNNTPIPDEPVDDPNLNSGIDGSSNSNNNGQVPVGIQAAASPALFEKSAFGTPSGASGLPIMGVHSKSKALAIGPAKWRDLEKNEDSSARYMPAGVRLVETSLLREHKPEDIVACFPEDLHKFVGPRTRVVAVSTHNPLGVTFAAGVYTSIFGSSRMPINSHYSRELF